MAKIILGVANRVFNTEKNAYSSHQNVDVFSPRKEKIPIQSLWWWERPRYGAVFQPVVLKEKGNEPASVHI